MRILAGHPGQRVTEVLLMLTPDEAKELCDLLDCMLKNPESDHIHVNDRDYKREITAAIYTPENLHTFSDQVQALINEDEEPH